MRTIVNISLPIETKREIAKEVKDGGYASVSEFFRTILRERKERALYSGILESRREFDLGKGKRLRGLRDLRA
jgi:Arc/MetJ-type ribon-helix-helix transcriptional regulator